MFYLLEHSSTPLHESASASSFTAAAAAAAACPKAAEGREELIKQKVGRALPYKCQIITKKPNTLVLMRPNIVLES